MNDGWGGYGDLGQKAKVGSEIGRRGSEVVVWGRGGGGLIKVHIRGHFGGGYTHDILLLMKENAATLRSLPCEISDEGGEVFLILYDTRCRRATNI